MANVSSSPAVSSSVIMSGVMSFHILFSCFEVFLTTFDRLLYSCAMENVAVIYNIHCH